MLRIDPEEFTPKPGARQRILEAGIARQRAIAAAPAVMSQKESEERQACVEAMNTLSAVMFFSASCMFLGIKWRKAPSRLESQQIIDECAAKHGVHLEDISGPRQAACMVHARQEAMYRLYDERKELSMKMICHLLNRGDHTTIVHGIRAHAHRNGLPLLKRERP